MRVNQGKPASGANSFSVFQITACDSHSLNRWHDAPDSFANCFCPVQKKGGAAV
jgi:hypothetical protein